MTRSTTSPASIPARLTGPSSSRRAPQSRRTPSDSCPKTKSWCICRSPPQAGPGTGGHPHVRSRATLPRFHAALEPADGPLCALDVDGVLESTAYGFRWSPRPRSWPCVRWRVTASGQSQSPGDRAERRGSPRAMCDPRFRWRCRRVRSRGVRVGRERAEQVVSDADVALLDRLRNVLRAKPGARVDEDLRYSSGSTTPARPGGPSGRR